MTACATSPTDIMTAHPLQFRHATHADIDSLVALIESAYRGDVSKQGWTTEADMLGGRRTGIKKPFPYGDERFGLPKRDDLRFEVLEKAL